ncbi:transcription factor PIF3 isoform X2 [Cajanus cajan]|uniref:transcription factor PIF3 isoform X2 n=1 Tax=Cajanus cajan TaxID=3821 RepID=UPI00098DC25D|nr:transcription factor PIF3 isoform X2 [Cajanus cajan]
MNNNTCGTVDQSSTLNNDLFELVWEKGQISVQGQSSRARKNPNCKSFPSHSPRREVGYINANANNVTNTRIGKYENLGGELDVSEKEEDMVMPWWNYGVDDSLQHGYNSDLFHQLSGVTMNGLSSSDNFSLLDRRNNCNKVSRDTHKHSSFASVSRVENIAENNTKGEDTQIPSFSSGFSSLKMERQGLTMCSNSSTVMNFSHFAKPAAMVRANLEYLTSRSASVGIKNRGAAATATNPDEPKKLGTHSYRHQVIEPKSVEHDGVVSTKCDPSWKDISKIGQTSNLVVGESENKGEEAAAKNVEPTIVSSSVCSGNGAERGSGDPNQNLKQKSRDTEDFEWQSEDLEEESVGVKKDVPAPRVGSKRNRSAEVHNLSERRRRDRINEKMRTLQELIPNCNKADKASMLDDAIEYLTTLQLQLQIMSMGSGLCMPAMMLPPGMQHMYGSPHMSPYSGIGVGMQMRLGMGMHDGNDECYRFPMIQGNQHTQVFGLPMPMPHAPIFSFSADQPFMSPSTLGLNACETMDPMPQHVQNNNACSTNQVLL